MMTDSRLNQAVPRSGFGLNKLLGGGRIASEMQRLGGILCMLPNVPAKNFKAPT
jgi:hypothetical protein